MSTECPVSAITPQSQELIQIYARNAHMQEAAGASLFGPDMGKWPARMVDVFVALESERVKSDNAQTRAEHMR